MAPGASVIKHLRITISVLLAVAALMSPLSAWALGLGQIRVLSQRDQPLLAEIPIISNDPAELEALQARLASPDTFARIGLAPPQGIVSDLQFAVALDARGRPVVRVTSAAPVQQPLLTFLVEVDWGQGRLVREYSALLDTPQTAAAPVQPQIQEATVVPGNTVVRPAEPLPAPVATTPPPPTAPVPTPAPQPTTPPPAPEVAVSVPVPLPAEPLPTPAPTSAPAAPVDVAGTTRTVRPGETLGAIASELDRGFSLDQTIVALLRTNPEAFIGGNANRLKAGAVLRIPDDAGIARYTPDEAALVVREQAAQWRGSGRALPQPPAVVGAPAGDATVKASDGRASSSARSQARLEIVPPSPGKAQRAGTRSGVSAGGEGDMLRQQELMQTQETLAAREAEVQELKARVAELEQLQQKQNELIALKDSELAAAQQKLGTTQAAAPASESAWSGLGPWLGIAGGLVVIALAAVWWLRRRSAATPAPAPVRRDTARLAAAVPKAEPAPDAAKGDASVPEAQDTAPVEPTEEPGWNRLARPADPEPPKPPRPAAPPRGVPTWHAGSDAAPTGTDAATGTGTGIGAAGATAGGVEVSPLNPAPPGQGRLDLAKAYLDMGDRDTARSLLQEVATRGDSVDVRREAERLLRELG
jgi:pilus assembly protein FimV